MSTNQIHRSSANSNEKRIYKERLEARLENAEAMLGRLKANRASINKADSMIDFEKIKTDLQSSIADYRVKLAKFS